MLGCKGWPWHEHTLAGPNLTERLRLAAVSGTKSAVGHALDAKTRQRGEMLDHVGRHEKLRMQSLA